MEKYPYLPCRVAVFPFSDSNTTTTMDPIYIVISKTGSKLNTKHMATDLCLFQTQNSCAVGTGTNNIKHRQTFSWGG